MKERPILFSAAMVRAILSGQKSQTRRIIKPEKVFSHYLPFANARFDERGNFCFDSSPNVHNLIGLSNPNIAKQWCPYSLCDTYDEPLGKLWVRESWRTYQSLDNYSPRDIAPGAGIQYEALGTSLAGDQGYYLLGMGKLRPSIFMPRWASRILLEIVNVRVERLRDISMSDVLAEGCMLSTSKTEPIDYQNLWESINGPGSWAANPWVWCISFRRIK